MHSKIFVIGCDISESELWNDVKCFNGGIDYIDEETKEWSKSSIEWLDGYIKNSKIKFIRQGNVFRIDKESYLNALIKEKKEIIKELKRKLSVVEEPEKELIAYRNAGYSLYTDPRFGFLFYSEDSWLIDFDELCEFENENGEIEFEVTKTFDFHS